MHFTLYILLIAVYKEKEFIAKKHHVWRCNERDFRRRFMLQVESFICYNENNVAVIKLMFFVSRVQEEYYMYIQRKLCTIISICR